MSKKITLIKAAHYGETEARLAQDPIVIEMAKGLAGVPRSQMVHDGEDGGPRFEFMQSANHEYRERGGKDGGHIGAVAHALLMVLDSGVVKPSKVVSYWASRDVPGARGDEDRAMCHAAIVGNEPDFEVAKKALVDYMVKEASGLAKYDWAGDRVDQILAAVKEVFVAKFPGEEDWEQLSWMADGIQFQLRRVER